MREVRVTSFERFEAMDGEVRIIANSGDLVLIFPRELWESMPTEVSSPFSPSEPATEELEELVKLRERLEEHAREDSFATVLERVPLGGEEPDWQFDLVLRPAGMFAATTGYVFLPVVLPEHVAEFGARLEEDDFVEGAYLVGAAADQRALAAGDESLKVLSIRGRNCSVSRFELAPELWQVLSDELGWNDVAPVTPRNPLGADHRNEG
jgi:hypothetical protein